MSQTMNGGSLREKKSMGKGTCAGGGVFREGLGKCPRPTTEDPSSWTGDQKGKLDGFNEGGIQRKLTIEI